MILTQRFHNSAQEFVYHLTGAFLLFGAAATLFTKMLNDDTYAKISTGPFKIAAVRFHYLFYSFQWHSFDGNLCHGDD